MGELYGVKFWHKGKICLSISYNIEEENGKLKIWLDGQYIYFNEDYADEDLYEKYDDILQTNDKDFYDEYCRSEDHWGYDPEQDPYAEGDEEYCPGHEVDNFEPCCDKVYHDMLERGYGAFLIDPKNVISILNMDTLRNSDMY